MNKDKAGLPLIWSRDLDAPIAWRGTEPISRRQYLADVRMMSERLPANGPMLNITADRYRFAVGLGAAMLRGHTNLLPPNHTPDIVARLHSLFPSTYCVIDDDADRARHAPLPAIVAPQGHAPMPSGRDADVVPRVDGGTLTAQVLTSGSTGDPMPHAKQWSLLVRNIEAGSQRLAHHMGRTDLAGVTLVATVPAQHMYGFESTVLIALLAGAAFETERPFYPADIARALMRAPRPRMLVTTPFHLKTLLDSGVSLPAIDLTLCATAPLPPQLAARAEAALAAPLMEIYGCTEAGQVATRRTTAGAEWRTYDGLVLSGDGTETTISGGHVPQPTVLADVLEVLDAQRFRLLGRSNDLINIAGKRSSLSHLNYHLNSIAGVRDGAFWLPDDHAADAAGIVRLTAFVVAPEVPAAAIVAALRERVDTAFLPRPVLHVPALPREPTGKLAATRFAAWAAEQVEAHRRAG
ncbi:MAG TPA: AMP-binding protein [Burkholderiaceae bacterium]|nr:AMP-binding protein [Burkholderiaceae bacterium]